MKKWTIILATALIGLVGIQSEAVATDWQAGVDDWHISNNWTAGEPTSGVDAYVTNGGTAQISQVGEVCERLFLGNLSSQSGIVEINAGELTTVSLYVGYNGTGTFTQTGGTNTVTSDLFVATQPDSHGTYTLDSTGSILTDDEYIGYEGTGEFIQTGGTNTVSSTFFIGTQPGSSGTYTMSAGSLTVGSLYVGHVTSGNLSITNADVTITVADLLRFGTESTFTAVPGSTIHISGSRFEIASTDAADLAGLSNLELIFEGGNEDIDPFEVAGAVDGGFTSNFALGALTLGGSDVDKIQLVDTLNSGNRGIAGNESLFAHSVTINEGSELDLNSLLLYVEGNVESTLDGWIADGRLYDDTLSSGLLDAIYVVEDDWTVVIPEPSTIMLLALGGFVFLKRNKK